MSNVTPTDPTPDEVARARRFADANEMELRFYRGDGFWAFDNPPDWLYEITGNATGRGQDAAWSALALALRPVFASVGPVIAAEERERCKAIASDFVDGGYYTGEGTIKSYMEGSNNASRCIADRIGLLK